MATLRMTWEAKVQLKEILINSGFPEGTVLELPLHSGGFLVIHGVWTALGPQPNSTGRRPSGSRLGSL